MKKLIAGFILFSPAIIAAQNASITGNIRYREDNAPAGYMNVQVPGTTAKTSCDENGHFSIDNLAAGTYVLQVTYFEHDTLNQTVTLKEGEHLSSTILVAQPKWIKDMKQAEKQKAAQDSINNVNRKYTAKRHQPKY
jgi:hypothetical protein